LLNTYWFFLSSYQRGYAYFLSLQLILLFET
jgi:hypothetical protein